MVTVRLAAQPHDLQSLNLPSGRSLSIEGQDAARNAAAAAVLALATICLLFVGLMTVYFAEFFASFNLLMPVSQRLLGFFRTATGCWLMYLTYAIVLNLSSGMRLPL